MKVLLVIFTLLIAVNITSAQENLKESSSVEKQALSTAIVSIEGMACQEGCADKISSNLHDADGVVSAVVSYDKKEAVITFDAGTITPEKLKNIITNTKVKKYVYRIHSIEIKD